MKLDQTIQQLLEKLPLPLQSEILDYVLDLEKKTGKNLPRAICRRAPSFRCDCRRAGVRLPQLLYQDRKPVALMCYT